RPASRMVRISVESHEQGRVRIAVADSGPGIPGGIDVALFETTDFESQSRESTRDRRGNRSAPDLSRKSHHRPALPRRRPRLHLGLRWTPDLPASRLAASRCAGARSQLWPSSESPVMAG